MILRALQPAAPATEEFVSAWQAVERTQTEPYKECWLITQPSHATLAAELAANVSAPQFPVVDDQLLKAFALHDAGWGTPDAQAIMKSRSVQRERPRSFVTMPLEFLKAWENSIETCESISPAGGYAVSRHFYRLAKQRIQAAVDGSGKDRQKLAAFVAGEEKRQKKLAARQSLSIQQLEQLTDFLQFCDLLSLYLCCGATDNVTFPEYFGITLRVSNHSESYKLDPQVIKSGAQFALAALRYPATKEVSSREIMVRIL